MSHCFDVVLLLCNTTLFDQRCCEIAVLGLWKDFVYIHLSFPVYFLEDPIFAITVRSNMF